MNYSFYGGRPGASFTIKKKYENIDALKQELANTTDNQSEVNYGEYVIIDAKNRNSVDNGKVYCREYNVIANENTEDLDGLRYIGQFAGPSGPAPTIKIVDWDDKNSNIITSTEDNSIKILKREFSEKPIIQYQYVSTVNNVIDDNHPEPTSETTIAFAFPEVRVNFEAGEILAPEEEFSVEPNNENRTPFNEAFILNIPRGHGFKDAEKDENGKNINALYINESNNKLYARLTNYDEDVEIGAPWQAYTNLKVLYRIVSTKKEEPYSKEQAITALNQISLEDKEQLGVLASIEYKKDDSDETIMELWAYDSSKSEWYPLNLEFTTSSISMKTSTSDIYDDSDRQEGSVTFITETIDVEE